MGHLAPSGDRTRNQKDNYATFLMSNIIPQNQENNSDIGRKRWWLGLEEFSRHLLEDGRELYIIAGARETKTNLVSPQGFNINVPERLWKVVIVLDKPGQTIADVNENTMAFAIDLPNIDPEKDTAVNPTDWRDYVISVEELENYLALQNYNFLSNIPTKTQKVIEERPKTEILQWINANYPTSSLLAKSEENNLINKPTLDRIGTNSAIRHDSFVEDNSLRVSKTKFSSSGKIGITEVGIFEPGFANNSISKYGSTEIDIPKVALTETGITKVNPFQTTSTETTVKKTGITKFGEAHIALDKSTQLEIGIAEVGLSKNTFSIDFASPFNSSKITSSQIFFSARESSDQFFIVHNQTPSSINTINNSALNLWNTLIQPSTPFDINLEIKNLPTGQLAEAQVTKFDAAGRPIGGTIEIDDDANGEGWFIDPTPTENSEFNQPLSETALRATNTEAAYGYDLLTTILHEMGHIAGIISGYNNYDRRIKTINGSPVFVGDDFIATLTPDLSHLDQNAHPYDLMNTHLTPGMRKLPSELNLKIINAIRSSNAAEQANTSTEANKPLTSPLTSAPLYGIVNGSFDLVDLENQPEGWSDRGSTNIEQGYAVLREDSPFLSNLSQTFLIPEGAKTLQFTIKDTQLGTSKNLPNDAVEVALLDPTTLTPLAGTSTGFSDTDSLLNLQANGTAYHKCLHFH